MHKGRQARATSPGASRDRCITLTARRCTGNPAISLREIGGFASPSCDGFALERGQ